MGQEEIGPDDWGRGRIAREKSSAAPRLRRIEPRPRDVSSAGSSGSAARPRSKKPEPGPVVAEADVAVTEYRNRLSS